MTLVLTQFQNDSELFGRTIRVNIAAPQRIKEGSTRPVWSEDTWLQKHAGETLTVSKDMDDKDKENKEETTNSTTTTATTTTANKETTENVTVSPYPPFYHLLLLWMVLSICLQICILCIVCSAYICSL